jgi:uncharacterized iron-regulated protein
MKVLVSYCPLILALALLPGQAAAVAPVEPEGREAPKAIALGELRNIEQIIPNLADKRVVFVGETHDRYDHHLNQLSIIKGLHERVPELVIAMEFFQQPYQEHLDAFVAGEIDEAQLLHRTEYFRRWGYDYRHYRPILQYARENGIPLLALNVPQEVTRRISEVGLAGLSDEERAWVPADIAPVEGEYRERLREIFEMHPMTPTGDFDRFLEVQLVWDEGMADRAARYLEERPEGHMVVLAGMGHLAYGSGIPQRLTRRVPVSTAIVLHAAREDVSPEIGDFLLFSQPVELPPRAQLGVLLTSEDGLRIERLVPESAAGTAGVRADDEIVALDGAPMQSLADLRLALLEKQPGDTVRVTVQRSGWLADDRQMDFDVVLQ